MHVSRFRNQAAILIIAVAAAIVGPVAVEAAGTSSSTALVIPAAELRNTGENLEDFLFTDTGHIVGEGIPIEMIAPVYLPNATQVTMLRAWVVDNATTCGEVEVYLRRVNLVEGDANNMAFTTTEFAIAGVQSIDDSSIATSVIDNMNYAYYVIIKMCSTLHEVNSVVFYYVEN